MTFAYNLTPKGISMMSGYCDSFSLGFGFGIFCIILLGFAFYLGIKNNQEGEVDS